MPPTLTVYVKDSITKELVAVAEVSVSIGDQKVGAGHTDRKKGSFTKSIDSQYVGQTLTCRVSKDGYEPQEATYKIGHEDIRLDIELVPEERVEEEKTPSPPPPPPLNKFQKIEQHPDYLELMRYTPSIRGRGSLIFMIGFGVLFIVVCLFMLIPGPGSPPAIFFLVVALMIVFVLGLMGYLLFRWRRLKAAPLQRVPAIVLDKRTEVSSGDFTYYYVTLELRGGNRQEYNAEGKLYGLVSRDDMGVAYIKDRSLLDFRRLTVETSQE